MTGVVIALFLGLMLSGCTWGPTFRTSSTKPAAPQDASVNLQSDPAGAEATTSDGQICVTPCSLKMPVSDFTVTFTMAGHRPETVPVRAGPVGEQRSDTQPAALAFTPNPVFARLERLPPPAPPPPVVEHRPPPKKRVRTTRPAPPATPARQPPPAAPARAPAAPPPAAPWPLPN